MAIVTTALDVELKTLDELMRRAPGIAAQALYKGAGVMADAYKQAANSIVTEPYRFVWPSDPPRFATPAEKAAVVGAVGIAKFDRQVDSINTSVGLGDSGYAKNIRTKKYPNGKPIPMIANSINSGSSFIVKQPFARKAEAAGKAKAQAAMEAEAQRLLDEVTNKNG